MPKRSTPFQALVHYLRKQTAAPGVTVTESKELLDARLGVLREVDVVVEGSFDGEHIVISIEVIEHGRRASITWVEQQIGKHRTLPTNRLILVSKSGFSKNALAAVAMEGGWVQALTPKFIQNDSQESVQSLVLDRIELTPLACTITVQRPEHGWLPNQWLSKIVFNKDKRALGSVDDLAREVVRTKSIVGAILRGIHDHPGRDYLRGFSIGTAIDKLGYLMRDEDTGQFHLILTIEIEGEFEFKQSELTFRGRELGDRSYSSGEGVIFGRPGIWVATTDEEARIATIAWRMTDNKPAFRLPVDSDPMFPELANSEKSTELKIVSRDKN